MDASTSSLTCVITLINKKEEMDVKARRPKNIIGTALNNYDKIVPPFSLLELVSFND